MNEKLRQVSEKVAGNLVPLFVVIVVCLSAIAAGLVFDVIDFDDNQTVNQPPENQTDLNVSKYYDNETQVCRSPEINQTSASELKACVSNQTSVS